MGLVTVCTDLHQFSSPSRVPILVHNQCSGFELTSSIYFVHNAIWIRSPDQKVDANTVARASLGRDVTKDEFSSALIYKLQRKNIESGSQPNADKTFSEDTSTSIQLLIMWRSTEKDELSLHALLIKHSNEIIWDEDKLKKLYSMHLDLLVNDKAVRDTWLLDNVTVLRTMLRWEYGKNMTEIIISEETKEDDSKEPLWVPSSI
jgi:hypothetical protein